MRPSRRRSEAASMTIAGWAQIVLFLVVLTALTPLVGGYMARVYGGEPIVLDRVLGPVERGFYRLLGTRAEAEQDWRGYARSVLLFSAASLAVLLPDPEHAVDPPLEPAGTRRRAVGPVVQHRRVVRDEHELAVLRRRDDDDELHADGRPGGAELRLGRRRHRRAHRGRARLRAPRRLGHRQLLVRPDPDDPLRPAAGLRDRLAVPRVAGRRPDASRAARRSGRWPAASQTLALGPGRLAGDHQGARDERRRLLQRQRRDAVREQHDVHELRAHARASSRSRRGSRRRSGGWSAAAARAGPSTWR